MRVVRPDLTPPVDQQVGEAICEALGVDPVTLGVVSVALVVKAGHWPTVVLRCHIGDDSLERIRDVVRRYHIIDVKVKETEVVHG